jgi:transposase
MRKTGLGAYSDDFRREAVRLLAEAGKPLKQIARELGVDPATLRLWRRQFAVRRSASAPRDKVPLLEEENRRLRRENARLLEEREILKKATAFFAKDAR